MVESNAGLTTLKIAIITPAAASARTGNRHTAARYAAFLRARAQQTRIMVEWDGAPCDVMIALHARRSLVSIKHFRKRFPERPLIVVLTGTDVYRDIHSNPDARESLQMADRLIVLQACALDQLTRDERAKTDVVYQSSETNLPHTPVKRRFRLALLGHLREEKDPFCIARALAYLPAPGIEVLQVGDALSDAYRTQALAWMQLDRRYRWIGGRPHGNALRWLASSHVMVLSSRMEGGANVICEAARIGVPVIASKISGNIGMLGAQYPGYYSVGDEKALAQIIERARSDQSFYQLMLAHIRKRRPLFAPASESRGLLAAVRTASAIARARKR
jgi:putative glycosyltransferase (TIGR04348 family)